MSEGPISETPTPAKPARSIGRLVSKILIGLVVVIGALSAFVAIQPSDYRIVRAATMDAPAEAVFEQVNDFHNWEHWSPWAKLDPQAKNTFEGPDAGKGAKFTWDGNDKVGAGRMTITDTTPNERIEIFLEFFRPMADTCTTEFTFKPAGEKTTVEWSMSGKHTFMSKAVCMVMNMDKMVGPSFEEGLASMKGRVEAKK